MKNEVRFDIDDFDKASMKKNGEADALLLSRALMKSNSNIMGGCKGFGLSSYKFAEIDKNADKIIADIQKYANDYLPEIEIEEIIIRKISNYSLAIAVSLKGENEDDAPNNYLIKFNKDSRTKEVTLEDLIKMV